MTGAPRRLVLDAGPLIALFHVADADHRSARAGFGQLERAGGRLLAPLPIVFEVYKWLLYEAGPAAARRGLAGMGGSLEFVAVGEAELEEAARWLGAAPSWAGSLEDACVAYTALREACPVWTLNYRDLAAFKNLEFWTPG